MATNFFDYDLPPALIAQEPCPQRDRSRLLVVRRTPAALEHRVFADLPELLAPGDLLVLNDTRVLPARLLGRRERTGGHWEGLFLEQRPEGCWVLLCQTRGRLQQGETILIGNGELSLHLLEKTAGGQWLARPGLSGSVPELLERFGNVPLPPYIRKGHAEQADRDRYQTVFAEKAGSVAAPTAGLHFTAAVFDRLHARGIHWTFVTLHVGPGTFQPIRVDDPSQHRMHREWGELTPGSAEAVIRCRADGGKVVAVGTTSVRVLESVASIGPIRPWSGETELFIHPPYEFKAVDALVTNFHLPRSTLLCLVSALAGVDLIRLAYMTAMEQRYRFYSYGDAMLIV